MNDRRRVLGTALGLGLASLPTLGLASARLLGGRAGSAVARATRARPLGLHAGSQGGLDAARAIHLNFARLVEYNLARLAPRRFEALWHDLTATDALALAQLYDASVRDAGGAPLLLEIMAERADIDMLARVAAAFGPDRVLAATAAAVPGKLPALASALSAGAGAAAGPSAASPTNGPTIDYTMHEIYLSYRTAPVGSLSVAGSLFMATRYAAPQLMLAWGTGYGAGSVVAPLIQHYAPSVWNGIGASVHTIMETLGRVWDLVTTATFERQTASSFQIPGYPFFELGNTGGDFGVVWSWHSVFGGGGGSNPYCLPLDWCPTYNAN